MDGTPSIASFIFLLLLYPHYYIYSKGAIIYLFLRSVRESKYHDTDLIKKVTEVTTTKLHGKLIASKR